MTLYLVHGNKNLDQWGYESYVFGIYTEKDAAEAAKDLMIKKLYEISKDDKTYSNIQDISEIYVEVEEIEADKGVDIYLGGYTESGEDYYASVNKWWLKNHQ